jgi:hypothetical protein|tara:strand:+ start:199 stop:903 length:705 start_codon:yes stop_codon:yes gene_type:complete
MSKKVSEANPGIKALAKKAPEVVQKMGYTMQMNKSKVTNENNFSNNAQALMAEASMYMLGKSKSTDPKISTIELDSVTVTGDKKPSKTDQAAQYAQNIVDLKKNIHSEILENIHRPDSTIAQIGGEGITYKKGYDHRAASDYTDSAPNTREGRDNIYMGRGADQSDGAPSFEFKYSKDNYSQSEGVSKPGDSHWGSQSGKHSMIRQYNKLASERYKEGKARIQANYPGLNFGGR